MFTSRARAGGAAGARRARRRARADGQRRDGVIALVRDAGATFLAPIFHELAGVVCTGGTPRSHIGIVSREFQVPCVMGCAFADGEPAGGRQVELDCSAADGEPGSSVAERRRRRRPQQRGQLDELIAYHAPDRPGAHRRAHVARVPR